MKRLVALTLGALTVVLGAVLLIASPAHATNVSLCHATADGFYERTAEMEVAGPAFQVHLGHPDDVIPPFDFGPPLQFAGRGDQRIITNDCEPLTPPTTQPPPTTSTTVPCDAFEERECDPRPTTTTTSTTPPPTVPPTVPPVDPPVDPPTPPGDPELPDTGSGDGVLYAGLVGALALIAGGVLRHRARLA